MAEIDKAMFYIFVLSLILVAAAYYIGTTSVLNSIGQNVGSLILTSTGRNAQGVFSAYPA